MNIIEELVVIEENVLIVESEYDDFLQGDTAPKDVYCDGDLMIGPCLRL